MRQIPLLHANTAIYTFIETSFEILTIDIIRTFSKFQFDFKLFSS